MIRLEYRIIQFFPEPSREEGRNIGIIAFGGNWCGFKAIGMMDRVKRPDASAYASIAPENKECLWVFGEWIHWFSSLCRESKSNVERINFELDNLALHGPSFSATAGGSYEMDASQPETVLDAIYSDLVGRTMRAKKKSFDEMILEALMKSEVYYNPAFESNIEVTIAAPAKKTNVVFMLDYYLPKREYQVGFKVLRFKSARKNTLGQKVNDAIYAFTHAQEAKMLEKERCVILCDTPNQKKMSYIYRLSDVSNVIDITKPEASTKIAKICA